MSDCLWGLLDGMNDRGLAISLTFGGRPDVGEGFAIALVVRYVLETFRRRRRLPGRCANRPRAPESADSHLVGSIALTAVEGFDRGCHLGFPRMEGRRVCEQAAGLLPSNGRIQ